MKPSRILHFDIARGIAIISIILGHLGLFSVSRVVYPFHLPVFFLLIGFFLNAEEPLGIFLRKRMRTLILPYVITALCSIVLGVLMAAVLHGNVWNELKLWTIAALYGAGEEYTSPFYIRPIGAIWFLPAAFFSSFFLKLILLVGRNYTEKAAADGRKCGGRSFWLTWLIRTVLVFLVFFFGYVTPKWFFWFQGSIQAGCSAVLYMYIGFLARRVSPAVSRSLKTRPWILLLSAVPPAAAWGFMIWRFESFWLVHCDFGHGISDFIGSLGASWCIFLLSYGLSKLKVLSRPLSFIGRNSLYVLCVHILELNFFPWKQLTDRAVGMGLPGKAVFLGMVFGKFVLIFAAVGLFLTLQAAWQRKRKENLG